jgi:hypothetical protein
VLPDLLPWESCNARSGYVNNIDAGAAVSIFPFNIAFAPALRVSNGKRYGQGNCVAETRNSFNGRHASFA